MPNAVSAELQICRKVRDGWYVYTCDQLPGLYVASKDDRKAFDDLPTAIRLLLKLDEGIDCVVTHKVEYDQFLRLSQLRERARAAVAKRTREMLDSDAGSLVFVVQQDRGIDASA